MAQTSRARDRAIIEQMLQDVRSPDASPGAFCLCDPPRPGVRYFQKAGSMLSLSIHGRGNGTSGHHG